MNLKQISQAVLVAALAGMALSVHAAETWTYNGVTSDFKGKDVTTSSNALTTTGIYAANNSAGSCTSDPCTSTNSSVRSSGIKGNWMAHDLSPQGDALGMNTDGNGEPNHALDNSRSNTEGVLLSFDVKTMLTGVDFSYSNTDLDISVWAYTGTALDPKALSPKSITSTGATMANMETAGWTLVGNYGDLTAYNSSGSKYNLINGATDGDSSANVNPVAGASSIASSWWLVTAYNTSYSSGPTTGSVNQGNDYFKLLSVAGTTCTKSSTQPTCGNTPPGEVPEPASLALVGIGLLGMIGLRRRQQGASAA